MKAVETESQSSMQNQQIKSWLLEAEEQSGLEGDRFVFSSLSSAVLDGVLHTLHAVSLEAKTHARQVDVNLTSG